MSTFAELKNAIGEAMRRFDWHLADGLAEQLGFLILREPAAVSPGDAAVVLNQLRRERRFQAMEILAQNCWEAGVRSEVINRNFAQALIDQGNVVLSRHLLEGVPKKPGISLKDSREASGLLGRISKQLYVNANGGKAGLGPAAAGQPAYLPGMLRDAVSRYWDIYRSAPEECVWQGINTVALSARAAADGVLLDPAPDGHAIARDIRDLLLKREEDQASEGRELGYWDRATLMECHVALGEAKNAIDCAAVYAEMSNTGDDGPDAFEFASTLRQMEEVWRLDEKTEMGKILPLLRGAQARSQGGAQIMSVAQAGMELQAVFGLDKYKNVNWYRTGLERCKSIVQICTPSGQGFGTGWVVEADKFFPGYGGLLILTNAHVVSKPIAAPIAREPGDSRVSFRMLDPNELFGIEKIVRSDASLDFTFLKLKGNFPNVDPIPLAEKAIEYKATPPQRLYVIGHPGGGELQFSLQDNLLVGASEKLVHYRTPTEPGSSGSPVFDDEIWEAVALHHAGGTSSLRLDGQSGTYQANEGITIQAIQSATTGKPVT